MSVSFNVYAGPAIRIPATKQKKAREFCKEIFDDALWCCCPTEGEGQEWVYLLPKDITVFPFGKTFDRHSDIEPVCFGTMIMSGDNPTNASQGFFRTVYNRLSSVTTQKDYRSLCPQPLWVVLPYFI